MTINTIVFDQSALRAEEIGVKKVVVKVEKDEL